MIATWLSGFMVFSVMPQVLYDLRARNTRELNQALDSYRTEWETQYPKRILDLTDDRYRRHVFAQQRQYLDDEVIRREFSSWKAYATIIIVITLALRLYPSNVGLPILAIMVLLIKLLHSIVRIFRITHFNHWAVFYPLDRSDRSTWLHRYYGHAQRRRDFLKKAFTSSKSAISNIALSAARFIAFLSRIGSWLVIINFVSILITLPLTFLVFLYFDSRNEDPGLAMFLPAIPSYACVTLYVVWTEFLKRPLPGIQIRRSRRRGTYTYPEDWETLRRRVYRRDGYRCTRCHEKGIELHAHHVIPLRQGGTNEMRNLTTLCADCHAREHPHMRRNRL